MNVSSPVTASPLAVSRAGRNNSPRIDYRTGKKIGEGERQNPPVKGRTASLSKVTKNTPKPSTASRRREERKRSNEKGSDSCSSTSSPTPKRMMNPEKSADGKSK